MKFSPDEMVSPKAIAPFEAAMALKLWSDRVNASAAGLPASAYADPQDALKLADGLGPVNPVKGETSREWADRVTFALFTLIKEI